MVGTVDTVRNLLRLENHVIRESGFYEQFLLVVLRRFDENFLLERCDRKVMPMHDVWIVSMSNRSGNVVRTSAKGFTPPDLRG